jgi:hypothetical protein
MSPRWGCNLSLSFFNIISPRWGWEIIFWIQDAAPNTTTNAKHQINKQQTTNNKQQTTNNNKQQTTTNNKQQTTNNKRQNLFLIFTFLFLIQFK